MSIPGDPAGAEAPLLDTRLMRYLLAVADAGMNERRRMRRQAEIGALEAAMPNARVRHFSDSHHDIHMERPAELAQWMLDALDEGFFAG